MIVYNITINPAAADSGNLEITEIHVCGVVLEVHETLVPISSGTFDMLLFFLKQFNDNDFNGCIYGATWNKVEGNDWELSIYFDNESSGCECNDCGDDISIISSNIVIYYTGGDPEIEFIIPNTVNYSKCTYNCNAITFDSVLSFPPADTTYAIAKAGFIFNTPSLLKFGTDDFKVSIRMKPQEPVYYSEFGIQDIAILTGINYKQDINPVGFSTDDLRNIIFGIFYDVVTETYRWSFLWQDGKDGLLLLYSDDSPIFNVDQTVEWERSGDDFFIRVDGTVLNINFHPSSTYPISANIDWTPAVNDEETILIGVHNFYTGITVDPFNGQICNISIYRNGDNVYDLKTNYLNGLYIGSEDSDTGLSTQSLTAFGNFDAEIFIGGGAYTDSTCCEESEEPDTSSSIIITGSNPGCCYSSTEFATVKSKLFDWALKTSLNVGLLKANGHLRIGNIEKSFNQYAVYNKLSHLITYALVIRKQMDCHEADWSNYISEEKIKCIINSFQCIGLDVTCVFKDLGIYYK